MSYDVLAKMAETNDCVVPLVITKFDWHPEERHKYPSSSTGNMWHSLKLSEVKEFVEKELKEHGAGCIETLNDQFSEFMDEHDDITRNEAYDVIEDMYTTYQNEYAVDYVEWFAAKIFVDGNWYDVTPDSKVMADWVIEYGGDYEFKEDDDEDDDEDEEDENDDDENEDEDDEEN